MLIVWAISYAYVLSPRAGLDYQAKNKTRGEKGGKEKRSIVDEKTRKKLNQ